MSFGMLTLGTQAKDFIWAVGIEDTFVPQMRPGHRALDEYELVGHYDHWQQDLALAGQIGANAIRWGVPWYKVQPKPDEYDWTWTDKVIPYLVKDLGIVPIVDLMHYGCPFWLEREFDNEAYPQAVAAYAAEFAKRYRGLVHWYTPLNEAFVNALLCGKRGSWPPYLRGDKGFVRIMLQLVRGIIRTVNALKQVDTTSTMVHVEATGLGRVANEDLRKLALHNQHRGYLSYDLLLGKVTPDHYLYAWLLDNGATAEELAEIAHDRISLDVIGLNFYPQWSTSQIQINAKGKIIYRAVEKDGAGFEQLLQDYYDRYQVPLFVTETSAFGYKSVRTRWLKTSIGTIKNLRARGVPIHGYTWFPLFTMYKWDYRRGRLPLEYYRFELGMYQLAKTADAPRFTATPLVQEYQGYIQNPEEAVGVLNAI